MANNSTCDTSLIFSGGSLPHDAGAYVAIDNVQLIPSPFVNLSLEKYRVGDQVIGGILKLTLNGEIVASNFNTIVDGQSNGTGIKTLLQLGQNRRCVNVVIQCASTLINGVGRIVNLNINEGAQPTWVNRAAYTIEIDLYENDISLNDQRIVIPDFDILSNISNNPYMLKNISEELSWSFNEETLDWGTVCNLPTGVDGFGTRHIKLNFSISATGIDSCGGDVASSGTIFYGLEAAEKYIAQRLDEFETLSVAGSLSNIPSYDFPPAEIEAAVSSYFTNDKSYMDFRTVSINPAENTISVNGEIIYRPKNCLNPDVFTTLNIDQEVGVDEEKIVISGTIKGLNNHKFEDIIKSSSALSDFNKCDFNTKMQKASIFLTKINSSYVLQNIANCYKTTTGYIKDTCQYSATYDDCSTTSTTSTPEPPQLCEMRLINSQINRNISAGEISFNYTLSNSANCDVLGARKIDVSYTHDRPHDNVIEIVIPGRGSKGALVQNLCCSSVEKYDVNIDAVLNKKSCNFNISAQTIEGLRECAYKLLQDIQTNDPSIDFTCWFLTNNVETIGNNSYKLNRTYVRPSCP
jgi:hypothetical protein